jgi:hypothetical protein
MYIAAIGAAKENLDQVRAARIAAPSTWTVQHPDRPAPPPKVSR